MPLNTLVQHSYEIYLIVISIKINLKYTALVCWHILESGLVSIWNRAKQHELCIIDYCHGSIS